MLPVLHQNCGGCPNSRQQEGGVKFLADSTGEFPGLLALC